MTSQPRPSMTLTDYIHELTHHHTHAEHYQVRRGHTWYGHNHITTVPPLLEQLWTGDLPSTAAEEGTRAGYGSKPVARLDALDTAQRIDYEVNRWLVQLGAVPRVGDTTGMLLQLHGLTPRLDAETVRALTVDVRRWWTRARIVTGWDSHAWAPDATCPQCGERGTLRLRLLEQIGTCTNDACRATWDDTTIGVLADHVRAESLQDRVVRRGRGPCWCPWPMPRVVVDLDFLCPGCGSARCRHALEARSLGERMGA